MAKGSNSVDAATADRLAEDVNKGNNLDIVLDLHTQNLANAKRLVKKQLKLVKERLDNGLLDRKLIKGDDGLKNNYIFYISCGAGRHSDGKAVLKNTIPGFVQRTLRYESYLQDASGVVLVHMKKKEVEILIK